MIIDNNEVYTEEYNGYKITISNDPFVYERDILEQTEGQNVHLHCDTRSLSLGDKDCAPNRYTLAQIVDNQPADRLFIGDYYEHSGICLKYYKEVTDEQIAQGIERLQLEHVRDYPEWEERRNYVLENYTLADILTIDTMSWDITIITPRTPEYGTVEENVKDVWDLFNSWIQGECYNLTIEEAEKCPHCNHVEWVDIDSNSFIGDYMPEVERAREMINNY